LEVIAV